VSQPLPWAHNQGKGLQGCGPRGKPESHIACSRCAKKCEGMNPHTPKWTPILGLGIPMNSWIFKGRLQRWKLIGLRPSLYHWKALGIYMSEMGSHDPLGHLKCKLWPKEGSKVKLSIWLLTTKSQEMPQFPYVQMACNIPLEISW
jgi:hypothetical protein